MARTLRSRSTRTSLIAVLTIALLALAVALTNGSSLSAGAVGANAAGGGASLCYGEVLVTQQLADSAVMIDQRSDQVVASIGVSAQPLEVAFSGDGRFAFTANYGGQSVSMISTATNAVVNTFPIGYSGSDVVSNRDGSVIFVIGSASSTSRVLRIDTGSGIIVASQPIPGSWQSGIFLSPDETRVWSIAMAYPSTLVVELLTSTMAISSSTPVAATPINGGARSPDGARLYLTDSGSNGVTVFDTTTHTATLIGPTSNIATLALSRSGTTLYMTVDYPYRFAVLDIASNTWTYGYPLGSSNFLTGMTVTGDGTKVYIGASNYANGGLVVIDVTNPNFASWIPLEIYNGPVACPLAVDPAPATTTTTASDPVVPAFTA